MMAYRTAVHSTTQQTPYFMMFGREILLPIDILYGNPNPSNEETEDYATEVRRRLESAFEIARANIATQHQRQKRNYDQRQYGKPYAPGDFVWFYNPRRKKGISVKLARNWQGPYLVLKRLNDTTYRIQKDKKAIPRVVHYDRLKLYRREKAQAWPTQDNEPTVEVTDDSTSESEAEDDDVPVELERPKRTIKPPKRYQ